MYTVQIINFLHTNFKFKFKFELMFDYSNDNITFFLFFFGYLSSIEYQISLISVAFIENQMQSQLYRFPLSNFIKSISKMCTYSMPEIWHLPSKTVGQINVDLSFINIVYSKSLIRNWLLFDWIYNERYMKIW